MRSGGGVLRSGGYRFTSTRSGPDVLQNVVTQKKSDTIFTSKLLEEASDMNVSVQRIWATMVTLVCVEGVPR